MSTVAATTPPAGTAVGADVAAPPVPSWLCSAIAAKIKRRRTA